MKKYLSSLLLATYSIFGGIPADTLVFTSNGYKTVKMLETGDELIGFNQDREFNQESICRRKSYFIINKKIKKLISITSTLGTITVSPDHKIYDPMREKWIKAKNITEDNFLTNDKLESFQITKTSKIKLEKDVPVYDFLVENIHCYFICDDAGNKILVHNGFTAALSAIWQFIQFLGNADAQTGGNISRGIGTAGGVVITGATAYLTGRGIYEAATGRSDQSNNEEIERERAVQDAISNIASGDCPPSFIDSLEPHERQYFADQTFLRRIPIERREAAQGILNQSRRFAGELFEDKPEQYIEAKRDLEGLAQKTIVGTYTVEKIEDVRLEDEKLVATVEAKNDKNKKIKIDHTIYINKRFTKDGKVIIEDPSKCLEELTKDGKIVLIDPSKHPKAQNTQPTPPEEPKPPKKDDDNEKKEKDVDKEYEIDYRENSKKHIFTGKGNHYRNTPENVERVRSLVNDKNNYAGKSSRGNNDWYAKIRPDGTQEWARVNNGKITGAGVNKTPRTFDPIEGFCGKGT